MYFGIILTVVSGVGDHDVCISRNTVANSAVSFVNDFYTLVDTSPAASLKLYYKLW